jgi:soluble lytic murein transglycosylase
MVAYAYNGGIGFVRRKVLPKFKYMGKYEPFLSMELIPYDESREYGKKVIANYVIYSQIFEKNITLHQVLKK